MFSTYGCGRCHERKMARRHYMHRCCCRRVCCCREMPECGCYARAAEKIEEVCEEPMPLCETDCEE